MPETLVKPEVFQQCLYHGSVKDVYGDRSAANIFVFRFSDRYSIFDWGEMPDSLPGKGEALAVLADLFFRHLAKPETWSEWKLSETLPKFWRDSLMASPIWSELKRSGLRHHSLGLVDQSGRVLTSGQKSNCLAVKGFTRPDAPATKQGDKLVWDYSAYRARPSNALVPLEVVFRFSAPEGSSFLERLEKIPDYAASFGFVEEPRAGEMFPYPIVEYFTKLEPSDRYLSRSEAKELASMTDAEMDQINSLTLLIALRLRDLFSTVGLDLLDGKFEFAFSKGKEGSKDRAFQLVDSIGPDELRLIGPGGVHFSKEILRRVYRDTPWYKGLQKAKILAKERGEKDWKKICKEELNEQPSPLPRELADLAAQMLPALVQALSQQLEKRSLYDGLPTVPELCTRLKGLT